MLSAKSVGLSLIKWDIHINFSTPKLMQHQRRVGKKMPKLKDAQDFFFFDKLSFGYDMAAAFVIHRQSGYLARDQESQHSSLKLRGALRPYPQLNSIQQFGDFLEEGNHFFAMWLLTSFLCSSRWCHILVHEGTSENNHNHNLNMYTALISRWEGEMVRVCERIGVDISG